MPYNPYIVATLDLDKNFRSGELHGKMLLVRIIENDNMLILGLVRLSKGKFFPTGLVLGFIIRTTTRRVRAPPGIRPLLPYLFSKILDPTFYQEVHLIKNL